MSLSLLACTGDSRDVENVTDVLGVGDILDAPAWRNVCGGLDALTWQGVAAAPGEPCGPCGDGYLSCAGPAALECVGLSETNLCGGCVKLQGLPGARCGACGTGVWVCDEDGGDVVCEGSRDQNACGGCAVLPVTPGDSCGTSRIAAAWRCVDPDSVRCIRDDQNVCGGTSPLEGAPGELCGTCGRGTLACDGEESMVCLNAESGTNACGGCAALPAAPGDPCAPCGGQWECSEGTLACSRVRNICGGCADGSGEVSGEPGDPCGAGGTLVCDGYRTLSCVDESVNGCGGTSVLENPPGRPCGPCSDGRYVCLSPELTACVGGSSPNVCGLCGVLDGRPGDACAPSAIWVCSTDGVSCSNELGLNACGGLSTFPSGGAPGDACGVCDSGTLVCAGANAVRCEGALDEEDYQYWPDVDGDGFGDDEVDPIVECEAPEGYVQIAGDCDDTDPAFNPDAIEDACVHAVDLNCDGEVTFQDADRDGSPTCVDCDDNDPRSFPGAPETCDGIDNDCDGEVDEGVGRVWYLDADGDGRGIASETTRACSRPEGYSAADDDCDDADPNNHPLNREVCDGQDNDCDGVIDGDQAIDRTQWYRDADGDGYGDPTTAPLIACDQPDGYVDNALDCDDADATIHPDATEVCDGRDNNCDGVFDTDAVDRVTLYRDLDGDGYGDPAGAVLVCPGGGYVDNALDCDDRRRDVHPGAVEIAGDSIDQDCDGMELCYIDFDGDGYIGDFGVEVLTADRFCRVVAACPEGYVKPDPLVEGCQLSMLLSPLADCDESDWRRNPGAVEIFGDGVDQNCDFTEICYQDDDGDNYRPLADNIRISPDPGCDGDGEAYALDPIGDCNDNNAEIHPAATEIAGDGVDQNCDQKELCYVNADNDAHRTDLTKTVNLDIQCTGSGVSLASVPSGDCNDNNPTVHPSAVEIIGNAIDNDCNGREICYLDVDKDGYRGTLTVETEVITCTGEIDSDGNGLTEWLATAAIPTEYDVCDNNALRNPGVADPPDDDAFDQNCDLRDGHATNDRYVMSGNSDTIQAAINACSASPSCKSVFVAVGRYPVVGRLNIPPGVRVHGGYIATDISGDDVADPFAGRRFGSTSGADWLLDPNINDQATASLTWLDGKDVEICPDPGMLSCGGAAITVHAERVPASQPSEFVGFRVEAAKGRNGAGQASIGVFLNASPGFTVRRNFIRAGNGGTGWSGSEGVNGSAGGSADQRIGGTSSCSAWGGDGGMYTSVEYDDPGNKCRARFFSPSSGSPGRGNISAGGAGSTGSTVCREVCDGGNCPNSSGNGTGGGNGSNGSCASIGGQASGSLVGNILADHRGWWPSYSGCGGTGVDGSGGGGAGTGGYYVCENEGGFICGGSSMHIHAGGYGGGGGAGGCRGTGGCGGSQGGASIGLLAASSGGASISNLRITQGAGGNGGPGGRGGNGGGRGTGAGGGEGPSYAGDGGRGGNGGYGGAGAGGAGGHGGPSYGVLRYFSGTGSLSDVSATGGAAGQGGAQGLGGASSSGCNGANGATGSAGELAASKVIN